MTNTPINELVSDLISTGNLLGISLPRDSTTLKPQATDYKLDQWGLIRKQGESIVKFNKRVINSKIWSTHDNSIYDLSIAGANNITQRTDLASDEYYFTYAGNATKQSRVTGRAVPVISAKAPIGQAAQEDQTTTNGVFDYSDTSKAVKGIWQYNQPVQGWDHNDFVGLDVTKHRDRTNADKVKTFYEDLYVKLHGLNA